MQHQVFLIGIPTHSSNTQRHIPTDLKRCCTTGVEPSLTYGLMLDTSPKGSNHEYSTAEAAVRTSHVAMVAALGPCCW